MELPLLQTEALPGSPVLHAVVPRTPPPPENLDPQSPADFASLLDDIIDNRRLASWFQPIINLPENRLIGYEALIRGPSDSPLHSPQALFDAAMRFGRFKEIELLARETNITTFAALELPGKLFLNVTPAAILQDDFPLGFTRRMLKAQKLSPDRVVIELTEQHPVGDYGLIKKSLDHYRGMGFSIALDDLGSAYAGLRRWSELRPEYVKFDRYFIQGIDKDPIKQQFIHSLHDIAHSLGCLTLAEGVETREEYLFLKSVGIGFGQGYYFARPSAQPARVLVSKTECVFESIPADSTFTPTCSEKVASLVRPVPAVQPDTPLHVVGSLLESSPEIWTIPVVKGQTPIGIVRRSSILNILASRFGRDLHGKQPIIDFMDASPVMVDQNIPVEQLSHIITDGPALTQRDDFVVTAQGRYLGIGTLTDLLRKVTDLQIRNARYANPLTLLPGNVPINEMIDHLVEGGRDFAVCYCDIDHFKAYNDYYGYTRGDNVIRLLAQILRDCTVAGRDFVGHIGGDDFIVVFMAADWQERCRSILEMFDDQVRGLYDLPEAAHGGIFVENRCGERTFFPIATLSIGSLYLAGRHGLTHHDISSRAAEAKSQAKKSPGSSHFIDRRRLDQPQLQPDR